VFVGEDPYLLACFDLLLLGLRHLHKSIRI
jgi:hypothetical protein